MKNSIDCPVDFITVNETQVRSTAFLVLLIAMGWILFGTIFLLLFLIVDFFLRAFNYGKYSLLNMVSKFIITQLNLTAKPIDRAPKRFAAKIGLVFASGITVLQLLEYKTAAIVVAVILLFFALLESVFGFCAGCHAYTFYKKFFFRKETV
jgi:Domain of unknown function (DUF4395)